MTNVMFVSQHKKKAPKNNVMNSKAEIVETTFSSGWQLKNIFLFFNYKDRHYTKRGSSKAIIFYFRLL